MPSRPILAYERLPFQTKPRLAMDAAPEGPDLYDRLGKLLRIVRRNLSPDEWAELGELLQENGAEDDCFDAGTEHIKQADGDPHKLLAPRSLNPDGSFKFRGVGDDDPLTPEKVLASQKPIKAGSVGQKDYWAQDARRRQKSEADRHADARYGAMFETALRIRSETGYGANAIPQPRAKTMNIADFDSFAEMFPDAAKIK